MKASSLRPSLLPPLPPPLLAAEFVFLFVLALGKWAVDRVMQGGGGGWGRGRGGEGRQQGGGQWIGEGARPLCLRAHPGQTLAWDRSLVT